MGHGFDDVGRAPSWSWIDQSWYSDHASMNPLIHRPQPLLNQLKHVTALQLRVLLGDGLLQLEEEALAAEAAHTRLTMVLAAGSGSADQFIG